MSGVTFCVWPRAYVHAAKAAIDSCFDQVALSDAYRSCIQSTYAKVTKMVKPSVEITVCEGKLIWKLNNASVTVHHQRKDENFEENYEKSVRGSFEITIDVTRPHSLNRDIYRANVNFVDLSFTSASPGNTSFSFGGNGGVVINGNTIRTSNGSMLSFGNGSFIINGNTISTSRDNMLIGGNGIIINGGSSKSGTFVSSAVNHQSDSMKRSARPQNFPDQKRHKNVAPNRYSGINQSVKSSKNDASIVISGIEQSVDSRGDDAVIVASGVDSVIDSSGNRASITSSGTDGSVISTGSHAWIRVSGCDVKVHSSGPHALIKASGTDERIYSSGSDAVITSSGIDARITSTGANADISFSGMNTWVKSSGSAINDDLGKTIIRRLMNAAMECLNRGLLDYSLQVDSSPHWSFANGYLCSTHLIALQDGGDPMLIATQDNAFPELQNSGSMLTLLVSNHIINAIWSFSHENNILGYNLTRADLIARTTINSSGRCCCLLDCIPEFSVKYPGASVKVSLNTIETPTATLSDGIIKVTVSGSAIFIACLQDGSQVDFLTADVTMDISVLLELNPGKLKGTVISMLPKSIALVNSAIGSLNREDLREVFDWIAAQYLHPKMDEIAQKGIPLPLPPLSGVVDFENAVMSAAGDFLRIDTDVKFQPELQTC